MSGVDVQGGFAATWSARQNHCPSAVSVSACGKAIVVGEHAVVYGAEAVAMPLRNLRFRVNWQPRLADSAKTLSFKLAGKEVSDRLGAVVQDTFEELGVKPFGLEISASSKLPIGAGVGSSAALSVAVMRAALASVACPYSTRELAYLANRLERRFHGSPSGLDTAVVAHEEVVSFRKGYGPTAIEIDAAAGFRFVLIDSGVRASTLTMIHKAKPYFLGREGERRLVRFDDIARTVREGLEQGDFQRVGEGMCEAASMLDAAGVVNDSLRQIIETATAVEGIVAAKPTGAGGGGCVLALISSDKAPATVTRLRQLFESRNVYEVCLETGES